MTDGPLSGRVAVVTGAAIPIAAGPQEPVGTRLYLVGDGAAWVTGQTIFVDGGAVPRL